MQYFQIKLNFSTKDQSHMFVLAGLCGMFTQLVLLRLLLRYVGKRNMLLVGKTSSCLVTATGYEKIEVDQANTKICFWPWEPCRIYELQDLAASFIAFCFSLLVLHPALQTTFLMSFTTFLQSRISLQVDFYCHLQVCSPVLCSKHCSSLCGTRVLPYLLCA